MLSLLIRAAQAAARLAKSPALRRAAVRAAQKAKDIFKNTSRKAVEGCKVWARNRQIRQAYNARKRLLKQELKQMRAQGKSREEIAKKAHEIRRNERLNAREQMRQNGDGDLVKNLEQRDLKKYGNKDGPDLKQSEDRARQNLQKELGRKPTQDEIHDSIAESATKTDIWTNLKFLTY